MTVFTPCPPPLPQLLAESRRQTRLASSRARRCRRWWTHLGQLRWPTSFWRKSPGGLTRWFVRLGFLDQKSSSRQRLLCFCM